MCKVAKSASGLVILFMLASQTVSKRFPYSAVERSFDLPKLEVISENTEIPWENDWEKVNLTNGEMVVVAKHKNNLQLHLLCNAPYRIGWLYDTRDTDVEVNKVKENIEIEQIVGSGSINVTMSLVLGIKSQSSSAVVAIKCEHTYSFKFAKIHVFIPGENKLLNDGKTVTYSSYNYHGEWIRCLFAHPKTDAVPLLFSYDSNSKKATVNHKPYDPVNGFELNEQLKGNYVCEAGAEFVKFVSYDGETENPITPTYITFVLKMKDIKWMCPKEDTAFLVQGPTSGNNILRKNITWADSTSNSEIWINLNDSLKELFEVTMEEHSFNLVDVFCVIEDAVLNADKIKRGRVTNKWTVNQRESSNPNVSINSTIHSHSYVNFTNEISFDLLVWERFSVENDVHIESKGLDKNNRGNVVYANQESYFECRTESFNIKLTFWMEFSNGSKVELEDGGLWSARLESDAREFGRFRIWKLYVKLPIDAVALSCQIPYGGHPTLYVGDMIYFQTKYTKRPEIVQSLNSTNPVTQKVFFGKTHCKLVCEAVGEPRPTYSWFKDDPNGTKIASLNLRDFIDKTTGYGVLEFPSITKSHDGVYGCVASNSFGTTTTHFRIEVYENAESSVAST